ncbi:MAG TPA: pentapeptide repeat-containing protein, partial [Coleofasciculaceae cyanobacterium]
PAELVLQEFQSLLSLDKTLQNSDAIQAIVAILISKNEQEFVNTLKRCCYILINNWTSNRNYPAIQNLIQLLADTSELNGTLLPELNRLKSWLSNFINSENYQELKLYAFPYTFGEKGPWTWRYSSYLLVAQSLDFKNPIEQRATAKNLSKRLKEKFNFELAMYTIRCEYCNSQAEAAMNPTCLGDGVIGLIKKIVSRNLLYSYVNGAYLFNQQNQDISYQEFKRRLKRYLGAALTEGKLLEVLNSKLSKKLEFLYSHHHSSPLSIDLLLRTCRRLIEFLTTQDAQTPSPIFILLTTQEDTLTLVILLLKIILICNYAQTHLEFCIAQLIRYYAKYPEYECQWFIKFLETFNIVFAIYTENIQYSLVRVKDHQSDGQCLVDLEAYRVFPQLKGADLRHTNLSSINIRNTHLSAADLRGSNLSSSDLSQADLSLAKLSKANLSEALLNGANLSGAILNHANLSKANLQGADLRCADLRNANLNQSNLLLAKIRRADLQHAEMREAKLGSASLIGSNLRGADLRNADLQYADLSEANLSEANLSNANLCGADLRHAKLCHANLSGARLHQANLSDANLLNANLAKANLNRANLEHANLQGATLVKASLRGARLSRAILSEANLSSADLSRADLKDGNLSGTNLSDALLRHATLNQANLSRANLSRVNLFSANLCSVQVKEARFTKISGLMDERKVELKQRGAIFDGQ